MFQDEAGFGRIFKPGACWAPRGMRPQVPAHHIREMRYAYGAVCPATGDHFFLELPYCKTDCMNIFLSELASYYSDKYIVLICDNAVWHKSKFLVVPDNIMILHIPPYTPEMNPIEQVWAEIRRRGFVNKVFATLDQVVDQLCDVIKSLKNSEIKSITHRDWIL